MPRGVAREHVDGALTRPLDEQRARQHDRDQWGLTADAIAAAGEKDALWGAVTYGEEVNAQ